MKKATVSKSETVALINLIVAALPIMPCTAVLHQTVHKLSGITFNRLLGGLVSAVVYS
ncbi:MAG: hypothetical protein MSS60_02725 [Clostridiales bacterium]|nr:hypothetical protein [Clostridiales bacterium]